MEGGSVRHDELAGELVEWWEDLWQRGMTSRVVLVAVPPGWGRTTVLDRLAAAASAADAPVTLIARIEGAKLPDEPGVQSAVLRECLAGAAARHPVAELLGVDRLDGITQLGLGVGGLFVSGLGAAVGFLVAGLAVAAGGKAWDDSPAGQDGALARTARAVARESAQVPVVVIVDDADLLDEDLAVTLVESLVARHDGHVLVVAAADPGSGLRKALVSRARTGITEGLVHVADADPDMGYESRTDLARELCPRLPAAAVRRIGHVAATFAEVFAIASARGLAGAAADEDEAEAEDEAEDEASAVALVDAVAAAELERPRPSWEAVVTAWAGGLLHARQAASALAVLGQTGAGDDDPDLLRAGELVRVTDPAAPRLAAQVAALGARDRRALAAVLLQEALRITADRTRSLVERTAAAQAAHGVRDELADRAPLPGVQRQLAAALEDLGEPAAALKIAAEALEAWPPGASAGDRDWLAAAVLRLGARGPSPRSPLAARLTAEAVAGGAGLGLEARVWAAAELLRAGDGRATGLDLASEVAGALDEHAAALGRDADQWRLLLAFRAGLAGHPSLAGQLLAPLLNSGDGRREDAARAVLHACAEPNADRRLQNITLEAELAALPPGADDDRLRIHHALAANYDELGEYREALAHGEQELALRIAIQSADHPDTLRLRFDIAQWAGYCGDPAGALRMFRELLPDQERVLGRDDARTLSTRIAVAAWTGFCGEAAAALRMFSTLLPVQERLLGRDNPSVLITRSTLAYVTGRSGDDAGALRMFRELLPDQERVFGPDHFQTLTTRSNIAKWTALCGDKAAALRAFRELLPDQERVLGASHFETLTTRSNIAGYTGERGDWAAALRMFRELLPVQERVLGPEHPETLGTRDAIAYCTKMLTSRTGPLVDGGAEQVPDAVGEGQAERAAHDHPQDGAAHIAAP